MGELGSDVSFVMRGLDPRIHVSLGVFELKDVDGWNRSGHDNRHGGDQAALFLGLIALSFSPICRRRAIRSWSVCNCRKKPSLTPK